MPLLFNLLPIRSCDGIPCYFTIRVYPVLCESTVLLEVWAPNALIVELGLNVVPFFIIYINP